MYEYCMMYICVTNAEKQVSTVISIILKRDNVVEKGYNYNCRLDNCTTSYVL